MKIFGDLIRLSLLALLLLACDPTSSGDSETATTGPSDGPREILEVSLVQDDVLALAVASCNAQLSHQMEETTAVVRITVTASGDSFDNCVDELQVELASPLGNREVVDRSTSDSVEVQE